MSTYIAFELDALNKAPAVARAARVSEDAVIGGLARLWAFCFREQAESVSRLQVAGFFAVEVDLVPALVAFGFLALDGESIRVRGADRYTRVTEQRRKAGKARAASAVRSAGKMTSDSQRDTSGTPAEDQRQPAADQLLHRQPTTEHRTPTTEGEEAPPPKTLAIAAFALEGPDPKRMESWSAQEFWKAFELERRAAGYAPEKWPSPASMRDFWTEARGAYDVQVLGMTASNFFRDKHWQQSRPPCPWTAFAKQWHKYVPRKAVAS